MSLLRSRELAKIIEKAKPILAVCDCSIVDELRKSIQANPNACEILTYDESGGELENRMIHHPETFENCSTFSDDISLIGFTSGTTGEPKGTIHFHRDVMSVCETVAEHIIHPVPNDIFISTAPLAFTFGLGGLVLFPLYGGSTSVLNGRYSPEELLDALEKYKATICFTVPTFYKKMARLAEKKNFANLRMSISSGEALAQSVKAEWLHSSGQGMTELLGSTEMLHAFIGPTEEKIPPVKILGKPYRVIGSLFWEMTENIYLQMKLVIWQLKALLHAVILRILVKRIMSDLDGISLVMPVPWMRMDTSYTILVLMT